MEHPMRRKDRALSSQQAYEVLEQCDVCRLAFAADPVPYILPMNYGVAQEQGETVLYFHCALRGRKLSLLQKNPAVGFEVDRPLSLVRAKEACNWGMAYESVIGEGLLTVVEDPEQKRCGLLALMRHYSGEENFTFPDENVSRITVLRMKITSISGKSRPLPV